VQERDGLDAAVAAFALGPRHHEAVVDEQQARPAW
jgi:urease accessory protein UreE